MTEMTGTTPGRSLFKKTVLVFLGFFLALLILEVSLRIAGYVLQRSWERGNTVSSFEKGHYRILCLGESTTAGGMGSYPRQLERILNERKIGVEFKVINKGAVGVNTARILSGLDALLDRFEPDMVVTMMGINDSLLLSDPVPYDPENESGGFLSDLRICKLAAYIWYGLFSDRKAENAGTPLAGNGFTTRRMMADLSSGTRSPPHPDIALGQCYLEQGAFEEAERILTDHLRENSRSDCALYHLGWCRLVQARHAEAEVSFSESILINPRNYESHIGLAFCHINFGRKNLAEKVYLQAIKMHGDRAWAYFGLGVLYSSMDEHEKAARNYRLSIQRNPAFSLPCIALARYHEERNQFVEAMGVYQKAVQAGIQCDVIFGSLATCCARTGDHALSARYHDLADRVRAGRYSPSTRFNYNRLKDRVLRRGLVLVCVQYPVRSVAPLKKLLMPVRNLVFVDNEQVFKQAIEKRGYDALFTDCFAGDFGHCTRKGNEILAQNIAGVLLNEVFRPRPVK